MSGIFLVAAVLASLPGCGRKPGVPAGTPVFLITLDTLRSDRLPMYGYKNIATPALDAFRSDAVLYERAYAHGALTLSSHATIMTGLLPSNHGVRDNTGFVLEDRYETLAERLKAQGYQTGAVVSSMVLRRSTGIARGFDFFEDELGAKAKTTISEFAQRRGDRSVNLARKWLADKGNQPTFFWLHLYDPHTPYKPPKPFAASYDGEIVYTDTLMDDFFGFLKDKKLYDKALIIVASDHGEGLGDHGEQEHGMLLYRESIQVPLLIKFPNGQNAGQTVQKPVGLFDLPPTIADALGIEPSAADGQSILKPSGIPAKRSLYAESLFPLIHYGWHAQKSVIREELHLIESMETEVYNMIEDPAEKNDLFGSVRVPDQMFRQIETVGEGKQATARISEEDRAMLESLGYAGSFQFGEEVKSLTFPELNTLLEQVSEAQKDLNEKRYARVEETMMALLKDHPALQEARMLLAVSLQSQEKYEQAEYLLMESLAATPKDFSLLTSLAEVKIKLNKWEDAATAARQAIEIEPKYAAGQLLPDFFENGRFPEAEFLARLVHDKGVTFAYADFVLGRTAMLGRRWAEARDHLTRASDAFLPESQGKLLIASLVFLAQCQAVEQKHEEALATLERALDLDPSIAETRVLVADALIDHKRPEDAERLLEDGLAESPENGELLRSLATVKLRFSKADEALALAERALEVDAKAIGPLSFAFVRFGKTEQVKAVAELALEYEKEQPYSHYLLGMLAHAGKAYPEARKHLETAIGFINRFPDPKLFAEVVFLLGDTEASLGNPTRAQPYFEKAIEIQPRSPRNQLTLAAFFARLGDKERALAVLERWLEQFPAKRNYGRAAQALASLGYKQEAEAYRQKAESMPAQTPRP